jgi:hypothetical protein
LIKFPALQFAAKSALAQPVRGRARIKRQMQTAPAGLFLVRKSIPNMKYGTIRLARWVSPPEGFPVAWQFLPWQGDCCRHQRAQYIFTDIRQYALDFLYRHLLY